MTARPLNEISGMPQIAAAFQGWFQAITLVRRKQIVNFGLVQYQDQSVTFQGTIQPLSPKMIALKPEGQRAFTWLQIHAKAGTLNLDVDDRVVFAGKQFKIMALLDYSLNGFIEYHAIEEYQK